MRPPPCPWCTSDRVTETQSLGNRFHWFVCHTCRHVWSAKWLPADQGPTASEPSANQHKGTDVRRMLALTERPSQTDNEDDECNDDEDCRERYDEAAASGA